VIKGSSVGRMSTHAFCLLFGAGAGVYAAQNYHVPDIKAWIDQSWSLLKTLEERSRK